MQLVPRFRASSPRHSDSGFTLIEVLIALGIMAFGLTAAIGLFTAATTVHKRALDQTSAALLADAVFSEMRGAVTLGFDAKTLEVARAGTPEKPAIHYFRRNATHPSHPGYVYDAYLTPVDALDAEQADGFHAEVRVRWKSAAQDRATDFRTVVVRRVAARDLR